MVKIDKNIILTFVGIVSFLIMYLIVRYSTNITLAFLAICVCAIYLTCNFILIIVKENSNNKKIYSMPFLIWFIMTLIFSSMVAKFDNTVPFIDKTADLIFSGMAVVFVVCFFEFIKYSNKPDF